MVGIFHIGNAASANVYRRSQMKSEPTIQDYISVIVEHRRLVILCVVIATIVAVVASLRLPKVYEAKVRFKLDLSEAKPVFFSEIYTPTSVDPVESELEIIRSRTLARTVVKKLWLNFHVKNNHRGLFDAISIAEYAQPGKYYVEFNGNQFTLSTKDGTNLGSGKVGERFDNGGISFLVTTKAHENIEIEIQDIETSVEELQDVTSASQIKNTALVLLKAKSTSSKLAADIANTLAEEYINYSVATLRESARGSKEFIQSQIEVFGEELNKAEEKLRQYKGKTGIFLLDESAKETISSLAQFEAEKEGARVELHEVVSTIENLETELSKDEATYGAYKRMASFPTISTSPMVTSLREKLKSLEVQKQELIQKGMTGRELTEVENRIKSTEEELETATKQIALAGPSVKDPIFQTIISNIITNETRAIALQSRIEALDEIIARQNYRLKQLPEAEVNLAQLERQRLANEEIYTMLLGKLEEAKIAEAMQIGEARIIDRAPVPKDPVEPKVRQNTVLGFLLGLIIGVGGAFLLEYVDTTLKSSKELEELTGLSVLATIPLVKTRARMQIPTVHEPHSQMAEAYRILRTNLAFSAATKPMKSLLITSTIPQEGKSTTCINLGITLALQGHKTILLDCDFRRPMLHRYFAQHVPLNRHGLADVLIDKLKLKDAIMKSPTENLYFIVTGTIPSNPSELLGSPKMSALLESLKNEFEFIVIDAPPALGVADARVLGRICDAILVVVMAKKTSRDATVEVKEELERSGEKIIGFVLNGIDTSSYYYRHHYYYYHPRVK
jgi:capsular exopolysaccharide synthesis family protein